MSAYDGRERRSDWLRYMRMRRGRVEIVVTVAALWTTDVISKPSSERVCVHDHVAGAGMHRALPSMDSLVNRMQILGNANTAVRVCVHCEQNARLRTDDHDVRSVDRALQIVRVAEPCDGAVPGVVDALRRLELLDGFRPSCAESIVLTTCSRSWPSAVTSITLECASPASSVVSASTSTCLAVSIVIGLHGEGVTDE